MSLTSRAVAGGPISNRGGFPSPSAQRPVALRCSHALRSAFQRADQAEIAMEGLATPKLLFDTRNVDKTCLSTKFVYKPAWQTPSELIVPSIEDACPRAGASSLDLVTLFSVGR